MHNYLSKYGISSKMVLNHNSCSGGSEMTGSVFVEQIIAKKQFSIDLFKEEELAATTDIHIG